MANAHIPKHGFNSPAPVTGRKFHGCEYSALTHNLRKLKSMDFAVLLIGLSLLTIASVSCSKKEENSHSQENALSRHKVPELTSIEFGVGVVPINFDMTADEVERTLGKPDRFGSALSYPNLGMALVMGKDGKVAAIMCGSRSGDAALIGAFKASTKTGLRMNSSKEIIVQTYGQPENVKKMAENIEVLEYTSIGAEFTLSGGKVIHLVIKRIMPQIKKSI